jgi:branched-chain amino acid transport system substrate-binding protein
MCMSYSIRRVVCTAVLSAVIGGAGCEKKPEHIRVGALLPLDGSRLESANQHLHGLVLALEELNASHPEVVLELVADNDRDDWSLALSDFRRQLIDKKILVEYATTRTTCLAVVPEAEKEFIPMFANCSHPLMTVMHLNSFRNYPGASLEVTKVADFVSKGLRLSRIALLYANDEYGKDAEKQVKILFAESGIELVAEKPFGEAAEPRAAATEALAPNPEAVYVYGRGETAAEMLAILRELGFKKVILGSYDFSESSFAVLARGSLEGCYYPMLNIMITGNKAFTEKYEARFKAAPTANSFIAYDAMLIIGKAVTMMRIDKGSITNALKKVGNFSGAAGDYEYVDREWLPPLRIVQFVDGRAQPAQ